MTVIVMRAAEISRHETLVRAQRGELRVVEAVAQLRLQRSQAYRLLDRRYAFSRYVFTRPSSLANGKRRPSRRPFPFDDQRRRPPWIAINAPGHDRP